MIMTSHTARGYHCRRRGGNNGADVGDDETDGSVCCHFCGCSDGVKFCSRSRSGNHRRRRSIVAYAAVWFLLIGLSQQQSTPSGSVSVDTDVRFSSSRTDDIITSTPAYDTYCETESFNATCDAPNDVILITHARYGRMRLSRCAKIDYGHIGCASDVLELADSRCSGRKSCEIAIPDALFAKSQPCPEDLKPYLEVGYRCMAVENPSVTCPFPGSLIISAHVRLPFRVSSLPGNATAGLGNTASTARAAAAAAAFQSTKPPQPAASKRQQNSAHVEGFLSNWVTETTGCGGLTSPWLIETDIGRRIHLTLFDFHVARASRPTGFVRPRCPLYAVVREQVPVLPLSSSFSASGSTHDAAAPVTGTGSRKQTICGGGHEREKIVYRSETNRIEVGLARTDDALPGGGPYFMLKYEVVGCADLVPIHGATMVRNGDLLTVKCNNSRDEYHLKCVNMQWVGNIHNCTTVSSLSTAAEKVLDSDRGSGLTGSSGTYDGSSSSSSSSSSSGGSGAGGSGGVVISYGSSVVIVLITALAIGLLVLSAGLMILTRRKASLNARRRGKAVGSRGASGSVRRSARGDYDKDGITSGRLLCNVDGVYGAREVSPSTTTTASGSNVIYVDTLTLPCAGCNSRAGSGDCDCAAAAAGHLMHHHHMQQQQQQQQPRHIFPPQSHSLHHHHHHYQQQQQHCHHPSSVGPQNLLLVSSDSPTTAQFCGNDDRIPEVVTVYEPTSGRLLGCAASFRNSTVGSSATVESEPSVSSPPNVVADVIGPDVTAFPVNVVPAAGTGNANTLTKPLGTNSTAAGQLQTDDLKFLQKSRHDSRKQRHGGGIRTAVSGGSGRRSVAFNSLDVSTGPAVVASPGEADPLLTSTTNATATGGIYDGVAGSGPGSIHTGGPRRLPPPPGTQIVASNDCSMPVEDLRAPRVLLS